MEAPTKLRNMALGFLGATAFTLGLAACDNIGNGCSPTATNNNFGTPTPSVTPTPTPSPTPACFSSGHGCAVDAQCCSPSTCVIPATGGPGACL